MGWAGSNLLSGVLGLEFKGVGFILEGNIIPRCGFNSSIKHEEIGLTYIFSCTMTYVRLC